MPKIFFGTRSLGELGQGSVLTIGAFDGVHRGHQAIIARLREKSAELDLPSVAVTFYPEPAQYFQPDKAPLQIMSWREKALGLLDSGVDAVVCLQFNEAVRSMNAYSFAREILAKKLGAKFIVVGDDFRFGQGREGSFDDLRELGSDLGFSVEQSVTHEYDGERISSTRVRKLLQAGSFQQAAKLLGKPYEICGRIVRGHQVGKTLGFATANVPLKRTRVAISGVYAVRVKVGGQWLVGAANVGYRPSVNAVKKPLLEVHILDFDKDIYGQRIRVRFEKKIREEMDFSDLDALRDAIATDVEKAQAWFGEDSRPASLNHEKES